MLAGAVFPWRSDNRFRLLVDGPQFFPAMIVAIERAERRIDLELYLVEDGLCTAALVEALCAAAGRGVQVCCLFDGFGIPQSEVNFTLKRRLMALMMLHSASDPLRHICIAGWPDQVDDFVQLQELIWPG